MALRDLGLRFKVQGNRLFGFETSVQSLETNELPNRQKQQGSAVAGFEYVTSTSERRSAALLYR
jgi:hypothetical protein